MKKIEFVTRFDQDKIKLLGDYAAQETAVSPANLKYVENNATVIWELSNRNKFLGYAGILRPNLLGDGIFWMLGTTYEVKSHISVFKYFAHLLRSQYSNIITYVEKDWKPGERFAVFCGFTQTEEELHGYNRVYRKYVWRA